MIKLTIAAVFIFFGFIPNSFATPSSFTAKVFGDHQVFEFNAPFDIGDKVIVDSYVATLRSLRRGLPTTLILNSPGGSSKFAQRVLADMQVLCNEGRGCNVTTVIPDNASCSSACLMIFEQGKERLVHPDATATAHSGYSIKAGFEHPAEAMAAHLWDNIDRKKLKADILESGLYQDGREITWSATEMLERGIATKLISTPAEGPQEFLGGGGELKFNDETPAYK